MTTALCREWAVIPKNENRIIIGLMRRHYTVCMRADGGHTSNFNTFCDIIVLALNK